MRFLFILLSLSLLWTSCKKSQLECDIEDIKDYLAAHNLKANSTDTGLHYIITTEGTGPSPTVANKVTVRYKGYLLDGTVFDQTQGNATATFPLAQVIQGWQEAIPYLKKNGKGTFFIPSEYAYGGEPQPGIPAWSVLIFEVELVFFQ